MSGRIRRALAAAVLALAGVAAARPALHRHEPPAGHTGGFGEPTCLACHTGDPLNAYGGSVRLEGLPEVYEPGAVYTLTVVLAMDETAAAGFQLAARHGGGAEAGRPAGTLRPLDERVAVTTSEEGHPYLHQTELGSHPASSSGSSWTFEWVAPRAAEPVALHLAANSANGDNSPLGDLVFTFEARIPAGVPAR